jgi:hypothetical protein
MASADVHPGPEVLAFGPQRVSQRSRRRVILLLIVVLIITIGVAAWVLRPRATDDFSFSDLQDVYAGMVRADGTNDAAPMNRDKPRPAPPAVSPESCMPLVETTLVDRFPATALDGMSTYWLGAGPTSAVSLFTLRYPDRETAAVEYQAIADALAACDGTELTIGRNQGLVTATSASYESGVHTQLSYLVKLTTGDLYAISVLQYANTITWQFRLEFGNQPYQPFDAQRLMNSFMAQVLSVEELRRS